MIAGFVRRTASQGEPAAAFECSPGGPVKPGCMHGPTEAGDPAVNLCHDHVAAIGAAIV